MDSHALMPRWSSSLCLQRRTWGMRLKTKSSCPDLPNVFKDVVIYKGKYRWQIRGLGGVPLRRYPGVFFIKKVLVFPPPLQKKY